MSDALFSALELDTTQTARTGYRLHQIEVYNWGTFDKRVWALAPDGNTSLLTGDIGSGKSTLVDAITTLLLPAHKISYNKAAGAGTKERSLRSYVEGHYRSERNEATGASRPVGLRDSRSYSVILGVFVNEGYGETVTIAQVFHQRDRTGQPERFYVTLDECLNVADDFSNFGSDLKQLRARLRKRGADIDTAFPEYARRVRRLLGIASEQAMELFHQTVSLKAVGNLNEFVRSHMLEPADSSRKVATIVDHFENLTRSHEAVQRATAQLAVLDPLMAAADRYDETEERRRSHEAERQSLVTYIAELSAEVLGDTIQASETEIESANQRQESLQQQRAAIGPRRTALHAERHDAGGDRLSRLDQLIPESRDVVRRRMDKHTRYAELTETAGLAKVHSAQDFRSGTLAIADASPRAQAELELNRDKRRPLDLERGSARARSREIDTEIEGLVRRRNNLPPDLIRLRRDLCQALEATETELPFAGELLDVNDAHGEWRGAAERVLRPFALSLLVPQSRYAEVSAWVNGRHLGAKLVFLRVPERRVRATAADTSSGLRLFDVLDIEQGEFADYVRGELARRAEHRLVSTPDALQREDRAVTRDGLVRDRDRHEKDDRFRVSDARRWVLGRNSERKIRALRTEQAELDERLGGLEDLLAEIDRVETSLRTALDAFRSLGEYTQWTEIDVEAAESELSALVDERERIVAGSTRLAEIDLQLDALAADERVLEAKLNETLKLLGGLEKELDRLRTRREREEAVLDSIAAASVAAARELYSRIRERMGRKRPRTIEDCDELRTRLNRELTNGIDTAQREMQGLTTSVLQRMGEMLKNWPELSAEMDASIAAVPEFRKLHAQVQGDDLPRFEAEFKRQLDKESVNDLLGFNQWLGRQADAIRSRVEKINEALDAIDYNPGRIIKLVAESTVNQEVRDFRSALRAATTDLVGPDDAQQRFERVRVIIERFRGREGRSDVDKSWTARVTDVRNWYTFAASERDRETGEEHEHYTDSDGKSGGQKEKLAYTILAASLAYQFKLEWGVEKSKDFRFAVIDEAFGRGSDQSTRYALDLFSRLGLQLLIVTPLQKVHVIEPYVSSIGFVDNPEGTTSRVHTLTIEEFRKRREAGSA